MNLQRLLSSDTSNPLSKVTRVRYATSPTQCPQPPQLVPTTPPPPPTPTVEQSIDLVSPDCLTNTHVDAHVVAFLKHSLGDIKWRIFATRLCERRGIGAAQTYTGKPPSTAARSSKKKEEPAFDHSTSPCAIEFLVKVEVVKEVLRLYVPHPYHPLKTAPHRWPAAPGGRVHITRTAVLALSGWSNTQFAYWARRSEAISVLAQYDSRLCDLAHVLYQRLYNRSLPPNGLLASTGRPSSTSPTTPCTPHRPISSSSASSSSSSIASTSSTSNYDNDVLDQEMERRARVAKNFTGKGLDGSIAEVKKRTGASQFLRGRQSSLDPFGANFSCVAQSPPLQTVDTSLAAGLASGAAGVATLGLTPSSPTNTSPPWHEDSWSSTSSSASGSSLATPVTFTFTASYAQPEIRDPEPTIGLGIGIGIATTPPNNPYTISLPHEKSFEFESSIGKKRKREVLDIGTDNVDDEKYRDRDDDDNNDCDDLGRNPWNLKLKPIDEERTFKRAKLVDSNFSQPRH